MRSRSLAARSLGLALTTVLLVLGCAGRGRLELIPGKQAGPGLAELVDSEPARRLLVDLLARRSLHQHPTATLVSGQDLDPAADLRRLPDQAGLRGLAEEVSLDFAALAFARALGADARSRTLQAAFDEYLREGAARSEEMLRQPGGFPYTVLFAPAWLYRSHPEVGADFGRQRQLLERLGIPHRLIPNPESASVEDNAAAIAAAVRETGCAEGLLILVSISKSGAEVALALSRLLAPAEAACVAGWLNTGGALGGTPLADAALRPPASWLTNLVLWFNGWNRAGLLSMATGPSRERLEGARLPDSVAVVNLVAVPVSGTVGSRLYGSYQILRRYGPNDGVVLLAHTVWPGGANLVALGSDHLFTALQEDAPALALLRAVDTAVRRHGAWPVPAGVTVTIGPAE
ncbi:MAG TPA: hypothetical protein VLG10_02785 [Methylomirabilota bacterium]|nr:hypothetical protein [Methylomirabilota bacterium]